MPFTLRPPTMAATIEELAAFRALGEELGLLEASPIEVVRIATLLLRELGRVIDHEDLVHAHACMARTWGGQPQGLGESS